MRFRIQNNEAVRLSNLKDDSQKTKSDFIVIKKDENRKALHTEAVLRWNDTPHGKKKRKDDQDLRHLNNKEKRADHVNKLIIEKGIDVSSKTLSDKDAFDYILKLIDDKHSPIGKEIYITLGEMTLREAFWEGNFDGAMYALTSRGSATVGGSCAEYIGFLVSNRRHPVLTIDTDCKKFKYCDQAFNDLGLVYCPIRALTTYADCTTMESAFQLLFDFLEIGRHRLWVKSGNGHSQLPLRKVDVKYIERSGDKTPTFMFGITILRNISNVKRSINANGRNVVVSITGGNGVACTVNQPLIPRMFTNESQWEALVAAQATLPPNFIDRSRKRKADALEDGVNGGVVCVGGLNEFQ